MKRKGTPTGIRVLVGTIKVCVKRPGLECFVQGERWVGETGRWKWWNRIDAWHLNLTSRVTRYLSRGLSLEFTIEQRVCYFSAQTLSLRQLLASLTRPLFWPKNHYKHPHILKTQIQSNTYWNCLAQKIVANCALKQVLYSIYDNKTSRLHSHCSAGKSHLCSILNMYMYMARTFCLYSIFI